MSQTNQCPECGADLPPSAPRGLCPACLLKRGLETNTLGYSADAAPAARWTPPTVEELSPRFPELEITRLIGRGGMGAVYRARQKNLDRVVALKILPPEIGRDPAFAERFTREAQAMARLNHPHIVTIHAFGQLASPPSSPASLETPTSPPASLETPTSPPASLETPTSSSASLGARTSSSAPSSAAAQNNPSPIIPRLPELYYFIMEYVDGMNLRSLLDSGHISPKEALAIVPQICDALQYAHDQGIVHRDIKPENILLNKQGQVKIADFGLAKLMGQVPPVPSPAEFRTHQPASDALAATTSEKVMGTPQYMAPEQLSRPAEVDHRADIYSLGVVFYQMLTGELPVGRFAPPSQKVQIDVRLDEVVLRALEREPAKRYQHVSEVKTQMETIAGTVVSAPPLMSPPLAHGREPRLSRLALIGAIWAGLFLILGMLSLLA